MRIFGFEITRKQALVPARPIGWWGMVTEGIAGAWQRNLVIDNTQSLLAFSAVFACVSLIAGDIAKLRFKLMRRTPEGVWDEFENPAFSPVLWKPNRYQTRLQFLQNWMTSKLVWGNTYILKERDGRNIVVAQYVLDPSRVLPLVAPDGEVFYQLGVDNLAGVQPGDARAILVPSKDIIHDRGVCLFHPLVGVPPIFACAVSTTQGNRIQSNSAKFFENMSRPSGQLTAPGRITDETAARMKRDFETGFSGTNIGKLLISGDGLKFEPFTMPANQAQLIEQLKFTVEDVARAFQVPLYKVQAGPNPSFSNIGALNQEYYQQTLQPHIEAIELLMDDALALPNNFMVELDLEGLLRMDPKTRAEANEINIRAAVLAPNEARLLENRAPVEGGDSPYLQQQNYSLAALAKRDAKEDPFAGAAKPPAEPPALPPPPPAEDAEEDKAWAAFVIKGLEEADVEYA